MNQLELLGQSCGSGFGGLQRARHSLRWLAQQGAFIDEVWNPPAQHTTTTTACHWLVDETDIDASLQFISESSAGSKNPTRYTGPLELPEIINGTSPVKSNERRQVSSPPLPGKAMFSKISLWFNCWGHFVLMEKSRNLDLATQYSGFTHICKCQQSWMINGT